MPICVSEPIGLGETFANSEDAGDGGRAHGTEADQQNAKFALSWSDFKVFHSRQLYHLMLWALLSTTAEQKHSLAIAMSGVALGDRLLLVGCTDASLMGAIGSKVGLSGRVCAIVPDEKHAARARRAAEHQDFFSSIETGAVG